MLWCLVVAWTFAARLVLGNPGADDSDLSDLAEVAAGVTAGVEAGVAGGPGGDVDDPLDVEPEPEEEEPRLPMKIGFSCDGSSPCCGAHIAMAKLAVQHVNEKDSRFVPELANLPDNQTMPRLDIVEILFDESNDLFDTLVAYYSQLSQAEDEPVALIGVLSTKQVEEISQLSQQFDIPVFSVATAGALGLQQSSALEYSNIYRMVAPIYEIARAVVSHFKFFDLKYGAVFYDPSVEEELRVLNEINTNSTGTDITFQAEPIQEEPGEDLTTSIDALLQKLEFSGVKIFVVLLHDPFKLKLVVERAYRLGLAGLKPGASGTAWFAATGFTPWELPDAVQSEYIGMLAIQQRVYDEDKIQEMAKEWKAVMPRGCGLSPLTTKFSTIMRNHMPYDICVGLANSYDSVVALALAEASLVSEHFADSFRRLQREARTSRRKARRLFNPPTQEEEPTQAERCENLAFGSRSLELNSELRNGVFFHGLSGEVDREGNPWGEKEGLWDVWNKNSKGSSSVVLTWSDDEGLQVPSQARRLARRVTDFVVPGLVWPGNVTAKESAAPEFVASTCLGVDCGNFGRCQTRPAIGREGGWCKCTDMFVGQACEIFYEPYRLVDHPGVQTKEPTTVSVLPYINKFHGIDSDEGTFKVTLHVLFMWTDTRVSWTLDPGNYTSTQAFALVREGLLWLPTQNVRRQSSTLTLGGNFFIKANSKMALLLKGEFEITADMDWRSFPFDEQELQMHLVPDGNYEAQFVLGSCLEADLPESVVDVCANMEHLGVPKSAFDNWPSLWEFRDASLDIDETGVKLNLEVRRDASTFTLRILVPSIFLVVISWAGFYINPKTLMPRFASSFISFLALQTFKTNAQKLTPADAAMITWTDVYMSAVGILMVFAVIENMFVPFANEHWAERSALFIDIWSRCSFPVVFTVVIAVMLFLRQPKDQPVLNIIVHAWLVLFTFVSVGVVIWEYRTFKHTIIQKELRRVKSAVKKQASVKLSMQPVELKSIFHAIDDDGSGIVEAEEVFPYLARHIHTLNEAEVSTMQQKLKHDLGEAFHQGVALDKFEPLFTKVMYMMVDRDYKNASAHMEHEASKKEGLHRV